MSTMEANEDKIDGALLGGQRLVNSNNLYSGKIQEKMNLVHDRSVLTVQWADELLNCQEMLHYTGIYQKQTFTLSFFWSISCF